MKNLLFSLIVVSMFVLSWFLGGELQRLNDDNKKLNMVFSPCDPVASVCSAQFADVALQLKLTSPVKVMSPFTVSVDTRADISDMNISFRMPGMEMGMQRYHMTKDENNIWKSEVILPVCSLGRSDWITTLDVKYMDQWWRGEIGFEAISGK